MSIKHYITTTVIFFVFLFATSCLSMLSFSDEVSSSCMDCSYWSEVLSYSATCTIIIPVILFAANKLNFKKLAIPVVVILFLIFTFLGNLSVFSDRVSAWSSYSTQDEIFAVLSASGLYLIIGGLLLFGTLKIFKLNR
ncbi:hypothetical protein [Chryseobacterium foetidum]|uniref:hypothetical protein n=1 Tax=Chryseobacterium foetidum TaxID=2951057 RepID=UPI0021C9564A|nr:hypothetical protein [Chryseobacterium foetidum]